MTFGEWGNLTHNFGKCLYFVVFLETPLSVKSNIGKGEITQREKRTHIFVDKQVSGEMSDNFQGIHYS